MNESKKLLYVRLVVIIVIVLFAGLFIFLIVRIDVVGHLFNSKNYIRVASDSNVGGYLEKVDNREFKESERENRFKEPTKKENAKVVEDKSIFKYINAIKSKNNNSINNDKGSRITRPYELKSVIELVEANPASPNKEEIEKQVKVIQSYYDKGYYPKSFWMLIDEDLDGYGYNYYFNDKGKLIVDTVAPDYRVVDIYGREVDDDLEPILYNVELKNTNNIATLNETIRKGYISNQTLLSSGVILKEKSKFYDKQMDRHVTNYIDTSLRFRKTTNGTIYDGSKWRSVSSLRDDGGYVIFNNPKNNFNKIVGKISTQKTSDKDDMDTICTLYVYDADLYELYKGYEDLLEPLYETSAFNYSEPFDFSFTFYRTVKRIRFQIETIGEHKTRTCYLKDLRYGFNKAKYRDELLEAKEREEYIAYMKELGIYQTDEEMLNEIKALEEDSTSDYLEYEDFNDIDIYNGIDLSDYDRNYDKEQRAIDRRTGPAFDEYLRNLKNYWEIEYGPGYE